MTHAHPLDANLVELTRYDAEPGSKIYVKAKRHREEEHCLLIYVCLHKGESLLGFDVAYCFTCGKVI